MNEETPKETPMTKDVPMAKEHREEVISWLHYMIREKEKLISEFKENVEIVRKTINEKLAHIVAEQSALLAIQRELATWEASRLEDVIRDPS